MTSGGADAVGSAGFVVHARSSAARERVFALLSDAPAWARWAGPTVPQASWVSGEGVGAVRRVGGGPLSVREQVVVLDPPQAFSYVLVTAARLHGYRADVHLEPDGDGTRITWSGRVTTPVPGLERVLLPAFRALVRDFARRLARAAERP